MVEIFAEISTLLISGLAKTSHMLQYTIQTSLAEFKLSGEIIGLCGLWNIYSLSPSILSKIVDMALVWNLKLQN